MSPIAEHLAARLSRELSAAGIAYEGVAVLGAEAEDWHVRVTAGERRFEFGFNHRDRLWCYELTSGHPRRLLSNDIPNVNTSADARILALRLIRRALADPTFPPRDPPVL